jgi:YegS/Rv2252/BmrU family lipid kinase
VIVVFNPAAGRRRAQLLWRVLDVLVGGGIRVELAETRHAGHATELAREAVLAGARLVVAAGGDGTIAEVANGLNGSGASLGVIPLGTANVLAHELGLPFAPRAAAAALAFGRTRPLWPGLADGPGGSRLFVQMLGAGFDAQVVHRMCVKLKHRIGRAAYVGQTLRELVRYRFPRLALRIDGVEHQGASVIVTKGRLYAGRYLLAPEARPGEPGFSVALFARGGQASALLYGAALPLNLLPWCPGLTLLRASRVEIMAGTAVPAQTDGDASGMTPLAVSDAPEPIQVVVG